MLEKEDLKAASYILAELKSLGSRKLGGRKAPAADPQDLKVAWHILGEFQGLGSSGSHIVDNISARH